MAAGPIALIGWLAVLSLLIIVVAGAFLALTGITPEGGAPLGFLEAFWESLMRTLDSGTMGGDAGWGSASSCWSSRSAASSSSRR